MAITEVEYMAVTEANKEMIRLQSFLEELGQKQWKGILHCDSQNAIHLAKNPVYHVRTRHIQVRYHYIILALEGGMLILEKIIGSLNPVDMLTKIIMVEKLKLCTNSVGLLLEV